MKTQLDLDGNPIDDSERIVHDFCCHSCYTAKNDKCTCRCGGKYHGKGKSLINEKAP